MNVSRAIHLIILCLLLNTFSPAQVARDIEQDYSKLLIDVNKPYVYLEMDHVGPRKPLRNDEPSIGIWLHIKNNCNFPIVVLAIGEHDQDVKQGIALQDEIVPEPQASNEQRGEDATGGGFIAPQALKDMTDIFRWPNMTEEEVRSAEEKQRTSSKHLERPFGYGRQNYFNSFVLTLIKPGDQLYFSVPANHVSKTWHFEIPFRLAVPNRSRIRPPYSYVAFYQEDLDQAEGKAATPTTR